MMYEHEIQMQTYELTAYNIDNWHRMINRGNKITWYNSFLSTLSFRSFFPNLSMILSGALEKKRSLMVSFHAGRESEIECKKLHTYFYFALPLKVTYILYCLYKIDNNCFKANTNIFTAIRGIVRFRIARFYWFSASFFGYNLGNKFYQ